MFGLLLNLVYLGLAVIATPVVLWQRFRSGKVRRGWRQKIFGRLPFDRTNAHHEARQQVVWLHAVSVGEVLQLRQVVERLRQARPDLRLLVTTSTETGQEVARKQLTGCDVAYFPMDFTWSVRSALRRVQPDLIVLVELELWPNFVRIASKHGIPILLINGRLSEGSHRGYAWIRPLMRQLLDRLTGIAVQSDEYRQRFLDLGAPEDRTVVTGSIKFDGVRTDRDSPLSQELREWAELLPEEVVLIAGSTQDPEEEMALSVYRSLRGRHPSLRLIIVPRHPERGNEIAAAIERAGFFPKQRSKGEEESSIEQSDRSRKVIVPLLDTVGELGGCWALADVAFVGGSFGDRGGQNMIEPAAYGAAVCFGPNTSNFKQTVEMLLSRDAARRVDSEQEWIAFVDQMLSHPEQAREMGERARALVLEQQGATDRTITWILECLLRAG